MSTNYYLYRNPCPHCGRVEEGDYLHIGKSSAGWCFSLHVIPEENINDLEDWKHIWESGRIKDEYGRTLTPAEMLAEITERSWRPRESIPVGATGGPNNLLRHKDRSCIKHGSGTWDCIVGEFS